MAKDRKRVSTAWGGASLLRRFAVGALVIFAVVGVLLYTLIRADARADLQKRADTFGAIISKALEGSTAVRAEDMTTGVPPDRLWQRLGPVVRAFSVESGGWEDVRLYAPDGRVVVASDITKVGTIEDPGPGVASAVGGEGYQEFLPAGAAAERFPELPPGEKLVTFTPFRLEGRIVGAVELVQSVEEEGAALRSGITTKLAIMGGGLILLYLGLLPVVARASRAQDEQKRITADLLDKERATVEKLRQLDRAKDDLLAFSAHEFRTPLTSLLGFAQTLQLRRGELTEDMVDDYLHTIVRQARRLQRVANDFLDAAAIEAGRLDVVSEEIPAATVARHVAAEFGDDVDLALDAEPMILADQDRLEQILTNLLRNALQHGPRDSRVRVALGVAGSFCRFEVTDDGAGLSPTDAERVFDKFERGPGRTGGSGLGLYISRHLAEAQGGTLTYVPDAQGTTFRVEVPLAPPEPAVQHVAAEPASGEDLEVAGRP